MSDAQHELNERTYRELGYYVVCFSGLLEALETQTILLIRPHHGSLSVARAALGGRITANPISDGFFAAYQERWKHELIEDDKKILQKIRKDVNECIAVRNRVMHDVWVFSSGGGPGPHELKTYRSRSSKDGVNWDIREYSPEALSAMAEECRHVADLVNMCGSFDPVVGGNAVHQRMHIDANGKVQPNQPRSGTP